MVHLVLYLGRKWLQSSKPIRPICMSGQPSTTSSCISENRFSRPTASVFSGQAKFGRCSSTLRVSPCPDREFRGSRLLRSCPAAAALSISTAPHRGADAAVTPPGLGEARQRRRRSLRPAARSGKSPNPTLSSLLPVETGRPARVGVLLVEPHGRCSPKCVARDAD